MAYLINYYCFICYFIQVKLLFLAQHIQSNTLYRPRLHKRNFILFVYCAPPHQHSIEPQLINCRRRPSTKLLLHHPKGLFNGQHLPMKNELRCSIAGFAEINESQSNTVTATKFFHSLQVYVTLRCGGERGESCIQGQQMQDDALQPNYSSTNPKGYCYLMVSTYQ